MSAPACPLDDIDGMVDAIDSEWGKESAQYARDAVDRLRFLLAQARVTIGSPTYANLEHLRELLDKFEGRTP